VARPTAIPPNLEGAILGKFGENWSSRRISAWLLTEHGVTASHNAVAKFLAKHRSERADIAKERVREKLSESLTSDLDELDQVRKRARALETWAAGDKKTKRPREPLVELKALDLQAKVLDRKLHYSGAGEADDKAPTVVGVVVLPAESDD
jgi:hypothetical protein